jgi:hypothetical protein
MPPMIWASVMGPDYVARHRRDGKSFSSCPLYREVCVAEDYSAVRFEDDSLSTTSHLRLSRKMTEEDPASIKSREVPVSNIAPCRTHSRLLATFVADLFFLSLASTAAPAQNPAAGRIVGHLDGIAVDASGAHIRGWACQQGRAESIAVHIYANEGASGAPKGIFALAGKADLDEEQAVNAACKDEQGRKHRFDIPLPGAILVKLHGMPLFVHGIRAVGGVANAAIAGSGTIRFPDAPLVRSAPASYPRVAGRYASLDAHPRVFDSREELQDIAQRANLPAAFTSMQFSTLAGRVRRDLAAKVDWQATYSGCDIEIYLRGFAYEQKPAYGNDRSDDQLLAAMHGHPGLAHRMERPSSLRAPPSMRPWCRPAPRRHQERRPPLTRQFSPSASCWPGPTMDFATKPAPSAARRKSIATLIPTARLMSRSSARLSARSRIRAESSIPSTRRISYRASAG